MVGRLKAGLNSSTIFFRVMLHLAIFCHIMPLTSLGLLRGFTHPMVSCIIFCTTFFRVFQKQMGVFLARVYTNQPLFNVPLTQGSKLCHNREVFMRVGC